MRRQVIEQAALFTWDICALSVFYGYFILLQTLRWCCVDCMIHHERDVREEQKCMYVARTSNNRVISSGDLYCCLLPRCESLRTCRSGFPIATKLTSHNSRLLELTQWSIGWAFLPPLWCFPPITPKVAIPPSLRNTALQLSDWLRVVAVHYIMSTTREKVSLGTPTQPYIQINSNILLPLWYWYRPFS